MSDRQSMYCHGCHHQWQNYGQGIECPACHSSSTEIITPENDPRHFHNPQLPQVPATSMNDPAAPSGSHSAGPESTIPAQADGAAPTGDTTQTQNQPQSEPSHAHHPPEIRFVFAPHITFVTTFVTEPHAAPQAPPAEGASANPSQTGPSPAGPLPAGGLPVTFFGLPVHFVPLTAHHASPSPPPPTGANSPGVGQEAAEHSNQPGTRQQVQDGPHPTFHGPPPMMDFMAALLSSMFNPANAVMGDAVYSQEAFERVMSQLREAQALGGAPPASQTAIDKLEVKEVDEAMIGSCEGGNSTRCVICVDEMAKGDKASVLPCSHFFHGDCVTPWLKQHNTCPVCRRPVDEDAGKLPKVLGPDLPPSMQRHQHHHHEQHAGPGNC